MHRFTRPVAGLLATCLMFLLVGCGGGRSASDDAIGISDTEIVIGSSYPFSGPASAYGVAGKTVMAYLDHINDEGGVLMGDGKRRTIKFITYDDGYEPEQHLANARKLIEKDRVFALFNMLGTPTHTAAVDYINQKEVPDIFLNSIAGKWSADDTTYPWTVGWMPTAEIEGAVDAQHLVATAPNATVAVLYQNDDAGAASLGAFKETIEDSGVTILGEESYEVTDPTVDSQVVKLAGTGADTFLILASPKAATQALRKSHDLGWSPRKYLWSSSASVDAVLEPAGDGAHGVISAEWLKTALDPRFVDDPAIATLTEVLAEYAPSISPEDRNASNGVAAAQTLVATLERVEAPTREALMDAVRNLSPGIDVPMLLPGITTETGPGRYLPVRALQLQQFDGSTWIAEGEPIEAEVG